MADFQDPMFLAVLVGWILTVILHEFAHGVVAYWGGDWTIRERGGLTLNPFQYIDPIFSLLLPAVFLLLGGIPLPGGVTYVRRDLLRSRLWDTAVSLAGPGMNLIIFLICAAILHPKVGWADYSIPFSQWTGGPVFLAAMCVLQMVAVLFNLAPVPPLDGFQAISPYLDPQLREKLSTPPLSIAILAGYFLLISSLHSVVQAMYDITDSALQVLGYTDWDVNYITYAFNRAVFGRS